MKAVMYTRYSSDNQREESIEAQIRAINEYAEKNGYQIIKIYADEAKSATTDNRPQFLEMVRDSIHGHFSAVIVHKRDRFSRDRYDSAFYKRALKNNGVKLISVLENLDDSPESIILESVLEGMAEYYSANLAREVMKGLRETAYQCKHTGGKAPLGYDVLPDKTYGINPTEADCVRLIFQSVANGLSYRDVITLLETKGYKTKTNSNFTSNSIYEILRNEKYTGVFVFNKTARKSAGKRNGHKLKEEHEMIKIPGGMPQIIPVSTWNTVQNKMVERKHMGERARGRATEVYALSGLLQCGECGGAMVGNRKFSGRNKDLYVTYECSTRKRHKTCSMKAFNIDYVQAAVIDYLEHFVFSDEGITRICTTLKNFAESSKTQIESDLPQLTQQLVGVEKQLNNLIDAIASGLINATLKERLDALELQKTDLLIRIDEAKRQLSLVSTPTEELIRSFLEKDRNIKEKSPEEQKRVLQTYIQKVITYNTGDSRVLKIASLSCVQIS